MICWEHGNWIARARQHGVMGGLHLTTAAEMMMMMMMMPCLVVVVVVVVVVMCVEGPAGVGVQGLHKAAAGLLPLVIAPQAEWWVWQVGGATPLPDATGETALVSPEPAPLQK